MVRSVDASRPFASASFLRVVYSWGVSPNTEKSLLQLGGRHARRHTRLQPVHRRANPVGVRVDAGTNRRRLGRRAIRGNALVAGRWLLTAWTFAAVGEEVGYRGYLPGRAADVGGRSPAAYWLVLVLVSILFGVGHAHKGPAGMIDSGVGGFVEH